MKWFNIDKLTTPMKVVIMTIVMVFNKESFNKKERSKEVTRDSDDTLDMKYNRLMSDAKKDRLIKIMHSHEVGLLDKDPMPFTIMMNPKTIKIRSEYFEMLKKYRKEKEK